MYPLKNASKSLPFITIASLILIVLGNSGRYLLLSYTSITEESVWFSILVGIYSFAVMFALPVALLKSSLFKRDSREFGLVLPKDLREAIKLTSLLTLPLLLVMYPLARQASFQEYYSAGAGLSLFFLTNTLASAFYYFAEEFLFRGLMFFSLLKKIGWHSFWVTNMIFTFFHIGKPIAELPLAFIAGMAFSYLSYKTGSFVPAAVSHFAIALFLNILIFFFAREASGTFHF